MPKDRQMKKTFVVIALSVATCAAHAASVITNYVYVVSNIYNQVFTENVVTQKIKSTHTNYYFTNNVTTINKIYNTTFRTNISLNCDVSQEFVTAASNQANRATSSATAAGSFADSAAASATAAGSHASSASASASQASYQREQAAAECEEALATINARINWFDEHSGETITQISSNVTFIVNIQDNSFGYTNVTGLTSFLTDMSNILMNAENGYPQIYTSPDGTAFSNIIYHARATANGKVAISAIGNYKAATAYRYMPYGGTLGVDHWIFEPAFVSTDANGLKLNYLPTQAKTLPPGFSSEAGNVYLPREFYWQNGAIYIVLDSYDADTNRVGRLVINAPETSTTLTQYKYPNGFHADKTGNSGTIGSQYRSMAFVSRTGTIMGTSETLYLGWLKTEYRMVLPSSDSILWFPERPTPAQEVMINWIAGWGL